MELSKMYGPWPTFRFKRCYYFENLHSVTVSLINSGSKMCNSKLLQQPIPGSAIGGYTMHEALASF